MSTYGRREARVYLFYLCELLPVGYWWNERLKNFEFTFDFCRVVVVVHQGSAWLLYLGLLLLANHMFVFSPDWVIITTNMITCESHCEKKNWTLVGSSLTDCLWRIPPTN